MAKSKKGLYYGQSFESELLDDKLFKLIRLTQVSLIELSHFQPSEIQILELQVKGSFFYEVRNQKTKRLAYLGRDLTTGEITYLLHDGGRLIWAQKEGFYTEWTPEIHEWIYANIGVLRKLVGVNDFIAFLAAKSYEAKGDYILG